MEETYKIRAIILDRQPFRESDLNISVYSEEKGRLNFVARGARKNSSKLAGHLEPINLVDIMAVKGKGFDYIGSAQSEYIFKNIKDDLRKIVLVGKAINFLKKNVRDNDPDKILFSLLLSFLNFIDGLRGEEIKHDVFLSFFFLKMLSLLGHTPELYSCVKCGVKISSGLNGFDYKKGGVLCKNCNIQSALTINDNSIKILRTIVLFDFSELKKLKISEKEEKEIVTTVNSFVDYNIS